MYFSVTWQSRLLNKVRDKLEAEGIPYPLSEPNWFKLKGGSGAMVAGQADLMAVASAGQVTVYDVKTGAQRDSDVAQVMIYMYALPLAAGSPWKGKSPDGRAVYSDGTEIYIPATTIDTDFRDGFHDLIIRVVSDGPAHRVPSPAECNWCDLTNLDCPERIDSDLSR